MASLGVELCSADDVYALAVWHGLQRSYGGGQVTALVEVVFAVDEGGVASGGEYYVDTVAERSEAGGDGLPGAPSHNDCVGGGGIEGGCGDLAKVLHFLAQPPGESATVAYAHLWHECSHYAHHGFAHGVAMRCDAMR